MEKIMQCNNLIVHFMYMYIRTYLYMVHVCTNGVEYRLQITYIEGPSSLFACVMIHDICSTFHVHGDW